MIRSYSLIACAMLACLTTSFVGRIAVAQTIYDTTGGAENGGDAINPTTGAGPIVADRFIAPGAVSLSAVTLNLELSPGAVPTGSASIDLFSDAGTTGPGSVLQQIGIIDDKTLTSSFALYTFTASSPYTLAPGTSYYIGLTDAGSSAVLGNTVDPSILARPSVSAGGFYYNSGGVQANSGGPYEIRLLAVPEPGSIALLIGMSVSGAGLLARRRMKANKAS